jgi:hypothetical protein
MAMKKGGKMIIKSRKVPRKNSSKKPVKTARKPKRKPIKKRGGMPHAYFGGAHSSNLTTDAGQTMGGMVPGHIGNDFSKITPLC